MESNLTTMAMQFQAIMVFGGATWNYDVNAPDNYYTHRKNITDAINEFAFRSMETTRYFIATFGLVIEITSNVHYSRGEDDAVNRPHFNVRANGKTYHLYMTKNHRKIVAITEIILTEWAF